MKTFVPCFLFMLIRVAWSQFESQKQILPNRVPHNSNATIFGKQQELAVRIYHRDVERRNKAVEDFFGGNVDTMAPWSALGKNGWNSFYLWDFFPASFNCYLRDRLGKVSDGGKVLCNPGIFSRHAASAPCVVLSFGVSIDISFETELASSTHCTIYAFDPTVDALPDGNMVNIPCKQENCGGKIIFEKLGLGDEDTNSSPTKMKLKTLETIMLDRGVTHIDILKIDIEGSEWKVFKQLQKSGVLQKVDQLSIELHFKQETTNNAGKDSGVRDVFDFFQIVESAGLYAFSNELNYNPSGYFNRKPHCIEYSFVRPSSLPLRTQPMERAICTCAAL